MSRRIRRAERNDRRLEQLLSGTKSRFPRLVGRACAFTRDDILKIGRHLRCMEHPQEFAVLRRRGPKAKKTRRLAVKGDDEWRLMGGNLENEGGNRVLLVEGGEQ